MLSRLQPCEAARTGRGLYFMDQETDSHRALGLPKSVAWAGAAVIIVDFFVIDPQSCAVENVSARADTGRWLRNS